MPLLIRKHRSPAISLSLALVACTGSITGGSGPPRRFDGFRDASSMLPDNGQSTVDVALADVDGDNDLDILWANQQWPATGEPTTRGGVEVSINLGDGQFRTGPLPGIDIGSSQFLAPADFDKDGDLDVLVSRASKNDKQQIFLLVNHGQGAFAIGTFPEVTATARGITFGRPAIADVDRDGLKDIVVATFSDAEYTASRPDLLFMNRGANVFELDTTGRLPTIPAQDDWTLSVATGDVNGDGAPDIFIGSAERTQHLFINDGAGRFQDRTMTTPSEMGAMIPSASLRAYHSQMIDIDADRDLDIVVINDASITTGSPVVRQNLLYRNDGSGSFTLGWMAPSMKSFDSRGLAFGDIDRDGTLDIVVGNATSTLSHQGAALQVALGNTSGEVTEITGMGPWTAGIFGVAIGDLNGDGFADVVGAVAEPAANGSLRDVLLLSSTQP